MKRFPQWVDRRDSLDLHERVGRQDCDGVAIGWQRRTPNVHSLNRLGPTLGATTTRSTADNPVLAVKADSRSAASWAHPPQHDDAGRALSRRESTLPCPAGCSGPWSRRTGASQASATGRGRRARKDAAAPRSRLASDAVVTEDGPNPEAELRANGATGHRRILHGRATSVPSTTVLNGPERTTTDNTKAARPAPLPVFAGSNPARSGFGSKGSLGPSLDTSHNPRVPPCESRSACEGWSQLAVTMRGSLTLNSGAHQEGGKQCEQSSHG
jgi:hypothetical protein